MTQVRSIRISDENVAKAKEMTGSDSLSEAFHLLINQPDPGRRHYETVPVDLFRAPVNDTDNNIGSNG